MTYLGSLCEGKGQITLLNTPNVWRIGEQHFILKYCDYIATLNIEFSRKNLHAAVGIGDIAVWQWSV